nr:MAG TPA: hypothetical protein [Caudoviricetes sp.]
MLIDKISLAVPFALLSVHVYIRYMTVLGIPL